MIKTVTVTNPKGEALVLELTNPEKSGLIVKSIEGLGPPKANINGQELATSDGMYYSSARANTRQIIFNLVMFERTDDSQYGRLSIEESRHLTYRYFPLKKEITIRIATDTRSLYCKGYVESNDPDIFSQNESAVISVVCPDPWFYTDGGDKTIFSGVRSIFEFPFSNESLVSGLIEFSEIWLNTLAILNYKGDVDTGVIITIHALDAAENIHIYNVDTGEEMTIDTSKIRELTGTDLMSRDDIVISTVRGDRYCKLLRNGEYTNLIGAISKDSDWFQITAGNNGFGFTADSGEGNLSVSFSYHNAYVGI